LPGILSATEAAPARSGAYKWIALSNTTLAMLLATIDSSIMLIAMPDVFRGIHLDPLKASNSFYLLWMILGYLVVTSVLVVGLGRLGDIYGRVRMYNAGFAVYTVASLFLTINWMTGTSGADYLIVLRVVQGIGAALLLATPRDPDRRVPLQPARARARDHERRRDLRDVHRPHPRRPVGADQLAPDLPRVGPVRPRRHGVGRTAGSRRSASAGVRGSTGSETRRSRSD